MEFELGATYELADPSKGSEDFQNCYNNGRLGYPDDSKFECTSTDVDGDCCSTTPGVTWDGESVNAMGNPVMCATVEDLKSGCFIKVEE